MSVVPRITCRRCGRAFSGLRSRCPYCGTRRVKQSDRSPGATPELNVDTAAAQRAGVNTKWQLIFGVILLAAVILAVVVLVSVSLNDAAAKATPTPPAVTPTETPPPTPTPSPTPTPTVESITITFLNATMEDFTVGIDNTVQLQSVIYPMNIDTVGAIKWVSSKPEIATVDDTGLVTGISAGMCYVQVECYGVKSNICYVHVN